MTSLPSWARRGVKVVCVDAANTHQQVGYVELVEGAAYTLREVLVDGDGDLVVRLREITKRFWLLDGEPYATDDVPFLLARFRPLVDDSDEALQRDVALFTEHLRTPTVSTTKRERADV